MVKRKQSTRASAFETYVGPDGKPIAQPVSPQAYAQACGLRDDNELVDEFRDGPNIAEEREAENRRAVKIGKGGTVPYPDRLVSPHGR